MSIKSPRLGGANIASLDLERERPILDILSLRKEFSERAVNVKWFGAKGDGVTDDTNAIQVSIDEVAAGGGGTVLLPGGIYLHTGLQLKSYVNLLGVHQKRTVLRFTPTSGNAITLPSGQGRGNRIAHLKLDATGNVSGAAILSQSNPTSDFVLEHYEIERFLVGVNLSNVLHIYIGPGRLIGQGWDVADGYGIIVSGNCGTLMAPYISAYHTGVKANCRSLVVVRPIIENGTRGFQLDWEAVIIGSWTALEGNLIETASSTGFTLIGPRYLTRTGGSIGSLWSILSVPDDALQRVNILADQVAGMHRGIQASTAGAVPAEGETGILVRRTIGGVTSFQRVSLGAADSGGAGYRVLRVPN